MNLLFETFFILSLLIIGQLIVFLTVIGMEREKYNTYICNGTKFFCKKSPGITCQITEIYPDDITACRLKLIVKYPSGHICNILTTTGVFMNVWEEDINDN